MKCRTAGVSWQNCGSALVLEAMTQPRGVGRGGARKGAGRPRLEDPLSETIAIVVRPSELAKLQSEADRKGLTLNELGRLKFGLRDKGK